MSFTNFTPLHVYTLSPICSAPLLYFASKKEVIFPTCFYSVSWILIIPSITKPETWEPSLLLLISSPSSTDFQKVTCLIAWVSSALVQSFIGPTCPTENDSCFVPTKQFQPLWNHSPLFLSWHSPAQHYSVISHSSERSSVQGRHTMSWPTPALSCISPSLHFVIR